MPHPMPCKTEGHVGPFPPTLPKHLPTAAALQVLGQYCPCPGDITDPGWLVRQGRRGANSRGVLICFPPALSCSLSPWQVRDRQRVLGDVPCPGRESLTGQRQDPPAPKLPAARPVAREKLYESFVGERVVNYHVPPLLTSANKSNYHRLMNRAQAHPRSRR